MAQFEYWMTTDLKRGSSQVQVLHGQTFSQDNLGNRVGVVVKDGNAPATLSGTVTGYVIRADGGTVVVAGAVDGNKAYIDLPESAYAVPGQIQIAIRLTSDSTKTVLGAISAYVQRTATGTIIDPGHVVPSLEELLAKLDDMDDAIAAAEQATSDAQDAADELNNGMDSIIKTQDTQPTEPLNKVWVDTSTNVLKNLPEVKDNEISAVDTWSSQKINAENANLKSAIDGLEEVVLEDVPVSIGEASKGVYATNGYQSPTSNKFVYFPKLGPGKYTITPAENWVAEYFKYISDTSGEQIYALGAATRTIEATDYQFVISARLASNEAYTVDQLADFVSNTVIIRENSGSLENNVESLNIHIAENDAEIAAINAKIDEINGDFAAALFERGDYSTAGAPVARDYVVRSIDTITIDHDIIIEVDEGFFGIVFIYPDGAGVIRTLLAGVRVPADTPFKMTIIRIGQDTAEVADVALYASKVHYRTSKVDTDLISYESYNIIDDRYAHIEYVDLLADMVSIDKRDSLDAAIDYAVKFHGMPFSVRVTTAPSPATKSDIRFTVSAALSLLGTQEFDAYIYIEDASAVSQVTLLATTSAMSKTVAGLVNGWNKLRFLTEGTSGDFSKADATFQLRIYTSSTINVWIGGLVAVKPEKANLIMIADGPYKTFYDSAYPAMKNLNVPITWALDPEFLGDNTDPSRQIISQEEVDALAYDGMSEFSFHSFDGTIMSTATAEQALADTLNNIRYLRQHGLEPQRIFRAAWLQNNCPNHALADLEVNASATYNPSASGVTAYPFPDRYNITRYSMQGRAQSAIDAIFEKLRTQHCTILMYTHGISDGERDLTAELFEYYRSKIEAGISAGWLNPTTYNRLASYYVKIG